MRVAISELDLNAIYNEAGFTREQLEDAVKYAMSNLIHPDTGVEYVIAESRIHVEIDT